MEVVVADRLKIKYQIAERALVGATLRRLQRYVHPLEPLLWQFRQNLRLQVPNVQAPGVNRGLNYRQCESAILWYVDARKGMPIVN